LVLNYYTLARWTDEIRPMILQGKVIEIFTQFKDEMTLAWVDTHRQTQVIEISTDAAWPYVLLQDGYQRKKRNSTDLFGSAIGQKVASFEILPSDRVIRLKLDSGMSINFSMFGQVNVFLIDDLGTIIDTFKDAKNWIGKEANFRAQQDGILENFHEFRKEISSVSELKNRLAEGLGQFNKTQTLEYLWRQEGDNLQDAFTTLKSMLDELNTGVPRIYWLGSEPKLFSLIELHHWKEKYPDQQVETYSSVNDALLTYIFKKAGFVQQQAQLDRLVKAAQLRMKKNQSLLLSLQQDLLKAQSYPALEEKAHLLNINIASLKRGMQKIELQNIYGSESDKIEIKLDPKLNPQQNIASYFNHAKKLRNSMEKISERIEAVGKENQYLDRQLSILLSSPDRKDVEKLFRVFTVKNWIKSRDEKIKTEVIAPTFKEYAVSGGWRVFVGQNELKNEELTFHFAKKDDWWFHARGVPGSHVVLKRDGRRDNPGKAAIEEAASIAAFFSKAKTSSLVPVIYTERKYVRKLRGGRPGQVIVERENVVIVPPKTR